MKMSRSNYDDMINRDALWSYYVNNVDKAEQGTSFFFFCAKSLGAMKTTLHHV